MENKIYNRKKRNNLYNWQSKLKGKTYNEIFGPEKAKLKIQRYIASRKGKPVSEETKQKISKTLTGKKLSSESIRKRTETRRKLYLDGKLIGGMKGKHHSEEAKKKIRAANINKVVPERIRQILREKYQGLSFIDRYGPVRAQEIIEKRRKKLLGRTIHKNTRKALLDANTGRKMSEETKKKISVNNLGKKRSWEQIRRIVLLRKAHNKYISPMKGKKHTAAAKLKMKSKRALQIMPLQDTSIEVKIQGFLKQIYPNFYTHQYINNIFHAYQCDIFIPNLNLVLECFGDYWHANSDKYNFNDLKEWQKDQQLEDELRIFELKQRGYNIMILWENKIKNMNMNEFKILLNKIIQNKNKSNPIFVEVGRSLK